MSSVEFDGTCTPQGTGPTAGDLVPGSRRVEIKKKKKGVFFAQVQEEIMNTFGHIQ